MTTNDEAHNEASVGEPAAQAGESASVAPSGGRQRSTATRVLVWILAALVLAGAVAGGVFGLRTLNRVRTAEAAVARAAALLDEVESDLLVVDEAVQVEISSTVATQAVAAMALAEEVKSDVEEASEVISDALPDIPQDLVPLANALKDSADARAEMMEIAPIILEADRKAALAIPLADQAVAEIKGAEELSAAAVVEFNKHTAESVRASDAISVQAEDRLKVAQSLIASATATYPGADYAPFSAYVDAKIGLVALAKEIDATWLAGDIAGSNTKLGAYNQRDAEIVAMAQALPVSVRDPIADAYNAETADASKRYFEARERARSAGERATSLRSTPGTSE